MKNSQKKNFINFRYFLILAIANILLITLLTNIFLSKISKIIFIIAIFLGLIIFIILTSIKKIKFSYIIISILICGIILSSNLMVKQNTIEKYQCFDNQDIVISARICGECSYTESGNLSFMVDNIKLISDSNSISVSGKMYIYTTAYSLDTTLLKMGTYISLSATISLMEMTQDNLSYLSNNLIGYAINSSTITVTSKQNLSIDEKIRNFLYEKLSTLEYGGVAYAMIFGDSFYISSDTITIFKENGIAHLLAVSGLHISIILTCLTFILKRISSNKVLNFSIILIFLIFYSYLCDFSISVIRASVMALLKQYSEIRKKPYDRLNSLSFASSLILLINPLKMYNYSYILSFLAVLVIILLVPTFKKFFKKFFYARFSNSISLALSVQLGLLLMQLILFGYFPVLSFLTNLISVPVAIFGFMFLLISIFLSIIFPNLNFLTNIFDFSMKIVVKFNAWINRLNLIVYFSNISILTFVLFLILIFNISKFTFYSKKTKLKVSLALIILSIIAQTLIIL